MEREEIIGREDENGKIGAGKGRDDNEKYLETRELGVEEKKGRGGRVGEHPPCQAWVLQNHDRNVLGLGGDKIHRSVRSPVNTTG